MDSDSDQDGLRQVIGSMVALESQLEESVARLSAETGRYLEAPGVIDELHSLVAGQRERLEAHLQGLDAQDVPAVGLPIFAAFEALPEGQQEGTIAALQAVATRLAVTAFGYAVLHGVAHRFFQKPTADLAEQHQRDYLEAALALNQAVGDVVVQELQDAGHACRCQCPACGPGICICWHVHVEAIGDSTEGIVVRAPRAGSNADRAGLRDGDVILAVDGHEVRTYQDMVGRMGAHEPGQPVELRVRRGAGDAQQLVVTR